MNKSSRLHLRCLVSSLLAVYSCHAAATNGMNMEGYGPVAAAMGGASMAYDNGTGAMMNNPATIGLMPDGSRLDLFFGFLGPDVKTEIGNMQAKSDGTAYFMPALGWAHKKDGLTCGLGMYGQGGMGTEYASDTLLGNPGQLNPSSNLENRSELSVGRIIAPLAFDVNDDLSIGGSVDFVWAGLDLRMAMSPAQFDDLTMPGQQTLGTASGNLVNAFGGFGMPLNYAYFDFSNDNRFSGVARGYGGAAKLGLTYRVNPRLRVGAVYHSKTALGDLTTDHAKISVNLDNGGTPTPVDLTGKIKVRDFQWPSTYGLGLSFQATDKLQLVADLKRINWADTMENFTMGFTADQSPGNDLPGADLRGATLDATLYQRWSNQLIYQVGGAYKVNTQLTLRAGVNYAKNPVPDQYLNALFPAIVTKHVTGGVGYAFDTARSLDFSFQYAPTVSATNPGNGTTLPAVTSTHSQLNWQVIYTIRF